MLVFWVVAFLLAVSAFMIFGIPMIMMGPRVVVRNLAVRPEGRIMAVSLIGLALSLFLVAGSFIQNDSADVISAQNFYSLHAQA
jgi:hypothetical protein